ncbi:GTP-binding protein [Micromonospora sp. CPCC 206061]
MRAGVNLIDTPGHPDFVAEVDRVLGVLDGAVLVISAVEGMQPQTRVLMRALRRLRVPTLLFLNKVDRRGAGVDRVLAQVERRLAVMCVPMSRVERPGARDARAVPCPPDRDGLVQALAGNDDALLTAYVEDEARVTPAVLRRELAAQTARAQGRSARPRASASSRRSCSVRHWRPPAPSCASRCHGHASTRQPTRWARCSVP